MSGLLDSIVRRRRATASSRLGPPEQNGHPYPHEVPPLDAAELPAANGHDRTEAATVNGHHGIVPATANGHDRGEHRNGAGTGAVLQPEGGEPAPLDEQPTTVFVAAVVAPEGLVGEPEPEVAVEPVSEPAVDREPGFRQRSRMRRRARYLRSLREVQLRDIGGFLLELHRYERQRGDLVQAKLAGAAETDRELRTLQRALGAGSELGQLREPGIGGACVSCGAVHGSQDRFCASCGEPLHHRERAPAPPRTDTV
ncbi:MAG: zinc ribbon domain-containing protein [Actinomycetota bacterium]|nr:zinc ribbon domain-containing protein [Actinomycetota bacterium]